MQSYVQRRRQLGVFRPRPVRNDVNAGAMPSQAEAEASPDALATPQERQDHYAKRCARRDLI